MKKMMMLGLVVFSTYASAASVRITSFLRVGSTDNMAELCGKLIETRPTPTFIKVVSDYNSSRPAIYNTVADESGKFCILIMTIRGSATAGIFGETSPAKATQSDF